MDRRQLLVGGGVGLPGLPNLPSLIWSSSAPTAWDAKGRANAGSDTPELLRFAFELRDAQHEAAFELAGAAIRSGTSYDKLLGAVFLAGAHDIRPRPHGILHAVMMVESSFQLAQQSPAREAWHFALWNLDDLKRAQERDRREDGDWKLPPAPEHVPREPGRARSELAAAIAAADVERADAALVGLVATHGHSEAFEVLWPLMARCYAFIGHKMIYAAQVERVLRRIGWNYAEPVLRSLVMSALVDRDTDSFDLVQELAADLPADWLTRSSDAAHSAVIAGELRSASPGEAPLVILRSIRSGSGPQNAWDAMRLLASEIFLARPGRRAQTGRNALLPVHAVTVVNAMGHAFRTTTNPSTKGLLLLQSAAWLAALRDDLGEMVGLELGAEPLDELGAGSDPPSIEDVFRRASPGLACSRLKAHPEELDAQTDRLRQGVLRRAIEHHQHKYAAAIFEECRLADARWRASLLAPSIDYLAHPEDEATELYRKIERLLSEAGAR